MIASDRIDLKKICIMILIIYAYIASLLEAVFNSLFLHIAIILLVLFIMFISETITKNKFLFFKTDLLFILSIIGIIASLHSTEFRTKEIAVPIVYIMILIITYFVRTEVKNYKSSANLIKWFSIVIALSVIFSYIFPSLYERLFLSTLISGYADNIKELMAQGYYTGFTSQVAYSAGYIINGIGLMFCIWLVNKNTKNKGLNVILFFLLVFALLLTQKRAHLLFTFISIVIVYLQFSTHYIEKFKKSINLIIIGVISSLVIIPLLLLTSVGETLFFRLSMTIQNLSLDQDISSGRLDLWHLAWQLFLNNPLLGVGWGNFSSHVVGTVTVETEMQTHNIYLQILSETGIFSALVIFLPMFITYIKTFKFARIISLKQNSFSIEAKIGILYSLFCQTFFLLYGLTGNPIYDFSYFSIYLISVGLFYSILSKNINQKERY
ncbi:O-antigen ligase family protein [Gracilibacillus alcaliphilus]|uniref:O-antigen ligase family protein n=1 Tax=Gracilibacillus alcaliphilus TaxID=1401441 RepID=UPI00195E0701|nr:O-antigen ligase family protein [Gracilibacillus alcaliphilus]MBM7678453.1 O-antigen ligase [Gracilibacillus alcaliphilus]